MRRDCFSALLSPVECLLDVCWAVERVGGRTLFLCLIRSAAAIWGASTGPSGKWPSMARLCLYACLVGEVYQMFGFCVFADLGQRDSWPFRESDCSQEALLPLGGDFIVLQRAMRHERLRPRPTLSLPLSAGFSTAGTKKLVGLGLFRAKQTCLFRCRGKIFVSTFLVLFELVHFASPHKESFC